MKTPIVLLKDILSAIEKVEQLLMRDHCDPLIKDALERQYITIGEAVRLLPEELKSKYKTAEWVEMVGMRNHLVHVYWRVDESILWHTAQEDIPALKQTVMTMLEELTNG